MKMHHGWARACLAALFLLFVVPPAWGQTDAQPEAEYRKMIRVDQSIHPLGAHPFGEDIALYNGHLSFRVTDISAAGNGPVLQLTRAFKLKGGSTSASSAEQVIGDWTIDLPRIQTLVTSGADAYNASTGIAGPISGWVVDGDDRNMRCQNFGPPPGDIITDLHGGGTPANWVPEQWWQGYQLIVPGQGSQDLLRNQDASTKITYPAVTKNHWRLSCITESTDANGNPITANGQPGDGFVAHAPDGTEYYFNELIYGVAQGASQTTWTATPTSSSIGRQVAFLLITKIEDRFGNTLTYNYDPNGNLTGIAASDGRVLAINYTDSTDTLVQSVTLQPASGAARTWTYAYTQVSSPLYGGATSLQTVTLPDNSQWQYQFGTFDTLPYLVDTPGSCNTVSVPSDLGPITATIVHPSGLTGTFTVQSMLHGRSFVPQQCANVNGTATADSGGTYAFIPRGWYDFTVTQRSISGAGVPTRTWQYQYSEPNTSWDTCTGSCPTTVWTKVVRPDDSVVKRTFSNKFDYTESHLLSTDLYANESAGTPLHSVANTYAPPTTSPLPASAGDLLFALLNVAQVTQYSPLQTRVITQDGDTYTWQAEAYNEYAQVIKTKRFNSIGGQSPIEEQTTYFNDTSLWVLGLPLQSDNLTDGITVDRYVYNTGNDTLLGRYHFCTNLISDPLQTDDDFPTCHKVMDYTFTSAGQLASFTDGNIKTTSLSNYKRGIPQTIAYPDSTSQTLSVDDLGQIASITDQAGKTTSYSYDAVGRLTQITYPTDSVAWYPETFTYDYVTTAERGLAANHWRRTVAKGDARHTTYFDALLRPVLSDSFISSDGTSHVSAGIAYDWKGQKTFESWPTQGSPSLDTLTVGTTAGTATSYDALGRVIAQVQPADEGTGTLTTTTAYLSGARQQVTDPKGNVTLTSYQVFDQPSNDALVQVIAAYGTPEAITQTITRDLFGNPTAMTQSGAGASVTKTLYYDGYHRLCRTAEPESGSTVVDYDAANNIAWSASGLAITGLACGREQVAVGSKTTRSYDAMNRVLTVDYPTSTDSTIYTYDARGNVATAHSGLATWTYARNAMGLLTDETLGIDGYNWPIDYTYDRYGSVDTVTYPDGTSVGYAPDALGRATQAGDYASGVTYFADGALKHFTALDGTEYLAEQNARDILSNFSYGTGSTLDISQDYTYDEDANLTGAVDLVDGTRDRTLSYDALNRLTAATAPNLSYAETYSYDALNNILSLDGDGLIRTYTYDAGTNRLSAIMSGSSTLHSFAYDARGNTTQKDTQTRVFDAANRLTQIPGIASYAYDAAGRRVKKTDAGGQATYYAYSSAGQLLWQYVPVTTTTGTGDDYVYLSTKLLAKVGMDVSSNPPAAPASITVPATSSGALTVTWAASTYAVTYKLQQQKDGGSWTQAYDGDGTATAFALTDGSYVYRVAACNRVGCSAYTTSTASVVTVPPSTAPALTVPAGTNISGGYTVSWSAVGSAATYTLQEQTNGGSWSAAYTGSATSKAISGKTNATYGYRVQACNAGGCGPWSSTHSVTVYLPPPTPSSITVPATSSGSLTASWSASSTATSYTLQHQVNGGSWSPLYTGSALSEAVAETATGSYAYRVEACNASGCSSYKTSSAVAVTIPPASAPAVTVPTGTNTTGAYTVSWSTVSGAASYTLQEQTNGGSWSAAYTGSVTSKAISGKTNATYGYRAQACNAGGCGPWSTTQSVTVLLPPPTPSSITVPATSSGSLTVSWASASTATSYTLQHQLGTGGWSTLFSGNVTSHAMTETATGSYTYRVEACNASGCSAFKTSSAVAVTIPPASAPAVTVPSGTNTTGAYTVSWSTVSGAASYSLQEQANGGSWSAAYTGSATSKAISGKTNATYGYRAQACNAGGCGPWSTTQSVTVLLPPPTPSSITVPATSSGGLTVSWASASTATSYTLQHQLGTGSWSTLFSGNITSHAVTETATGSYTYRVEACNASGCSAFKTSSAVAVTIPPASAPGLTVPSGTNGSGSYTVSWNAVSGATSYTLQEQVNGGSWSTSYSGSALSHAISGKTNATYGYRVEACNVGGCSSWSTTKAVTVLHPPASAPSLTVPAGTNGSGSYTVSWGSVSGATTYTLQEQVNSGSWGASYSGSALSHAISGKTNATYGYRVQACNAGGCSPWSSTQTVTVLHPPASAPSLTVPATSATGGYTASWGAVSGTTSYTLQEQVNSGSWSTSYSGSGLSKAYSGKTNGADYGYRVEACNAGGCSAWSATKAVSIAIPPAPPTGVYADDDVHSINLETVTVVWNAVGGANRYEVEDTTHGSQAYSGSGTSAGVESGSAGTLPLDSYSVRACNAYACSALVEALYRDVTSGPPGTPTLSGPTTVNATGSYTMSWSSVTGASSFTVQERVNAGSFATIYTGTALSKAFSGKTNGTYGYTVKACNAKGCSAWSPVYVVTVLFPPPEPASLSVPATSSGSISVSWASASTATSYTLQQQIGGGSWATVYSGSATSYAHTLTSSGSYVYRVDACNGGGCSGYRQSGTVTVTLPPNQPTLSVPTSSSTGSYTVSWSALSTATSYTLQQQLNGGSWSTSYSGSATSKAYSAMTNGATFGYRVQGCNAGGCSAWSTTQAVAILEPPTNVRITYTGSKITYEDAQWDAVSNVSHYDVKLDASSTIVYSGTATSYRITSAVAPNLPDDHTAYVRACYANGCSGWVQSN